MTTESRPPKHPAGTFVVTETLTPDEIERLKQRARETSAWTKTVYPGLLIVRGKEAGWA